MAFDPNQSHDFCNQPKQFRFDAGHLNPRSPMYSVNQVTMFRASFYESLEICRAAGVRNIGLWRQRFDECADDEAAIAAIHESGLNVSSVSFAGGLTTSFGYTLQEAIDDSKAAIRLARSVGASNVLLVPGSRAGHIKSNARRLILDGLNDLGDFAGDFEVNLAIYPRCVFGRTQKAVLNSLEETIDVINECNHPNIGLAFNCFHHLGEPHVIQRLADVAHCVMSVQLSDCRVEYDRTWTRVPLGHGCGLWQEMVQALLDCGYRGPFELDVWGAETWQSDYRELIEQQVELFENAFGRVTVK